MAHKNKSNYSAYKARRSAAAKPAATDAAAKNSGRPAAPTGATPLRGKHKKPETVYSVIEADERLADIFRNHGLDWVTHEQRRQLARFYSLLMAEQEHQNFTRLLKFRDIALKHFVDSLIITRHTDLRFPLLDLGTGPGFPGIPLKILFPREKVLLGEGVQKRVAFLKKVRETLELGNLDILGRNINPFVVYPVNGVITRAVEDMRNTLGNVLSCLQEGGRVYFMKGPGADPEIPVALETWGEYYRLVDDIAYDLPHTENHRRLVVFEKIRNAPLPNEEEQDFPLLEGE
ncbi:MAG: class I SAM-dependent methyltransferase [Bdellovibrionaceae bacterium]|nr:class I SAM-dependent methyltransferase [Pseudobdellovibrionaceae bacterium]MBX3033535.1 class I SAM-dependent methyltransferase [Pseudobdellovibrionaceae bacterium]